MLIPFSPVLSEKQANEASALALAHVGDAVFELLVRTSLVSKGPAQVESIHHRTVAHVNAEAQAKAADKLQAVFSAEELSVYKRGRNSHSHAAPHHMSPAAYHKATGLECLFGWLYLCGRHERILELFRIIWEGDTNEL